MSSDTRIAWTDATWNPIVGCSHVSPGCDQCYAEAMARRFRWAPKPWTAANAAENVTLHPERLTIPLHWRKPRRIFVCSMSDLFHEQVPDEFIDAVLGVIWLCRQHTFQVLTKRPDRMRHYFTEDAPHPAMPGRPMPRSYHVYRATEAIFGRTVANHVYRKTPANLWLGVTVEDQRRADERIPLLLQTPATIRFVSCEPLLGEIDLRNILYEPPDDGMMALDALGNEWAPVEPAPIRTTLDWVIAGCQTGPRARPAQEIWFRGLRDQCVDAEVPFFLKQMVVDGKLDHEPTLDGRIWRQFPEVGLSDRGPHRVEVTA